MKAILGPFLPDQNVCTLSLLVDDRLWCVIRKALHDDSVSPRYGLLGFDDVRASRCRARAVREAPDLAGMLPAGWWALQLDDSEYLRDSIKKDCQRSAGALSSHRHFVVLDGNHRVIDVVARKVTVGASETLPVFDIERLLVE